MNNCYDMITEQINRIRSIYHSSFAGSEVILASDGDNTGVYCVTDGEWLVSPIKGVADITPYHPLVSDGETLWLIDSATELTVYCSPTGSAIFKMNKPFVFCPMIALAPDRCLFQYRPKDKDDCKNIILGVVGVDGKDTRVSQEGDSLDDQWVSIDNKYFFLLFNRSTDPKLVRISLTGPLIVQPLSYSD